MPTTTPESTMEKEKRMWLSFCDTDKPQGQQFLGVIITKALDFRQAVADTWLLQINPGGEVSMYDIPDEIPIRPQIFDKLLSRQELEKEGFQLHWESS